LILKPSGITYKQLDSVPYVEYDSFNYRKYETSGFNAPGGKANIFSEVFAQMGYDPLPRYTEGVENSRSTPETFKKYPYVCFTGRPGPMYVHDQGRTLPWVREMKPEPFAMVNTIDAKKLGITTGDWIELASLRGAMSIKVEVTNKIGTGQIYVPGGWAKSNFNEMGIDDQVCPISSQPNYMTCLANVKKIQEERA
jgi:anaerobic selenocysteine-containing dehydrogenase